MKKKCLLLFITVVFVSCNSSVQKVEKHPQSSSSIETTILELVNQTVKLSSLEIKLLGAGLVNVRELDTSIVIELRYATTNNFLNTILYDSLSGCYLQPEVAKKMALAQFLLKTEHPNYSLKVFDGVRPRSVQQKMWDMLDMPVQERSKYVSNPQNGSLHNFGAAVDLTIIDSTGRQLDMGTPYDYFGELAYPRLEAEMLEQGKLSKQQVKNRGLLREVMLEAGFTPITTEWWHFNSCYRKEAWEKYKIVE